MDKKPVFVCLRGRLICDCFAQGDTSQPPTAPGKPGLISLFQERPWPVYDRYRIFVRAVDQSPTKWQYVGLYRATKLPAWTPKEVTHQQATVRSSCAFILLVMELINLRVGLGKGD